MPSEKAARSCLKDWFGERGSGRIGRVRFLLHGLLLTAAFLAIAFGLGIAFGLRNVLAVFLPLSALLGFAGLNLAAKRWRSIGLPGWPVSLGLAVGFVLLLWLLPTAVGIWAAAAVLALATLLPERCRFEYSKGERT